MTAIRRSSISGRVLSLPILLSGLVDLPRALGVGPVTGLAVLSIVYSAVGWSCWLALPVVTVSMLTVLWPFFLFLLWGGFSLIVHTSAIAGIQNLLMVFCFVGLILPSARESRRKPLAYQKLEKVLVWAVRLATGLYALSILVGGLGTARILAPRAFALFALFGLCWHLAAWHYGSRKGFWEALVIAAVIATSLSRLASAVALILFPLSQLRLKSVKKWLWVIVLSALIVGLGYVAVTYVEPVRSRFFEGDLSLQVGSLSINAMGRTNIWQATWDSWIQSPWIGLGPGSAQSLLTGLYPNIAHPHNDYLRVLHDYGLIGLGLWLLGLLNLLRAIWRARKRADRAGDPVARFHWAVVLSLIVFCLSMVTDNSMAYIFMMAPLGILVGLSLGRSGIAVVEAES